MRLRALAQAERAHGVRLLRTPERACLPVECARHHGPHEAVLTVEQRRRHLPPPPTVSHELI